MNPPAAFPVFVYGTLRKGGSNHFRMAACELVGQGTISGKMHRISWYPALVRGGSGRVTGELYLVPEHQLQALDQFEGPSYRRSEVPVLLDSGEEKTAWVWEWDAELGNAEPIEGGDWLACEPNPS
jgi:gamma-glutamylcyclotransferase (GGCT)/AIG2-like uncharacterized protein YtfP